MIVIFGILTLIIAAAVLISRTFRTSLPVASVIVGIITSFLLRQFIRPGEIDASLSTVIALGMFILGCQFGSISLKRYLFRSLVYIFAMLIVNWLVISLFSPAHAVSFAAVVFFSLPSFLVAFILWREWGSEGGEEAQLLRSLFAVVAIIAVFVSQIAAVFSVGSFPDLSVSMRQVFAGIVHGGIFFGVFAIGKTVSKVKSHAGAGADALPTLIIASLGLSAIGGFLNIPIPLVFFFTGLIVSQSSFADAITPALYRFFPALAVIFLALVGLTIEIPALIGSWFVVIVLSILLVTVKIVVGAVVWQSFGILPKKALALAIVLASGSETGWLIEKHIANESLLSFGMFSSDQAVWVFTILSAILLYFRRDGILDKIMELYPRLGKILGREGVDADDTAWPRVSCIIIGTSIEAISLEKTLSRYGVSHLRISDSLGDADSSQNVLYGTATSRVVLERAGVASATTIVVLERFNAEKIITEALSVNPRIKIICLCRTDDERKRLKALGVYAPVHPGQETVRAVARQVLKVAGNKDPRMEEKILALVNSRII